MITNVSSAVDTSISPAIVNVSIAAVTLSVTVIVVAAAPELAEVIASRPPDAPKVILPVGSTDIAIAPVPSASINNPVTSVATTVALAAPFTTYQLRYLHLWHMLN